MVGLTFVYYVLWFLIVAAIVAMGLGLRGRRQGDERLCRVCGYDLRGLLSGSSMVANCPECGAAIQSMSAVHIGRRRKLWPVVIAGGVVALLSLGGVFGINHWRQTARLEPYLMVRAIEQGDAEQVEVLIAERSDLAAGESLMGQWPSSQTPLIQAAAKGDFEIVQMLLRAGAAVDAAEAEGTTALHQAVMAGHADVVRLLLDHGADPEIQTDGQGRRVLHTAILSSSRPEVSSLIVPMLLEEGADADGVDTAGRTPLHYLASDWSELDSASQAGPEIPGMMVELLAMRGADVNAAGPGGDRPLHLSVRHRKRLVTQQLIHAGADVDVQNVSGDTPLHVAVRGQDLDLVKMLLAGGADVSIRNNSQRTAMELAATAVTPDREIVEALLDQGAAMTPNMRRRLGLDQP